MGYVVTLRKGATTHAVYGAAAFLGVPVIQPSKKYPNHPFFKMGEFRSPSPDPSTPLNHAVINTLDRILASPQSVRYSGLTAFVDWPSAKESANKVLGGIKELAADIATQEEKNLYQQAVEIIEETINFVLQQDPKGEDYSLLWQRVDDSVPK